MANTSKFTSIIVQQIYPLVEAAVSKRDAKFRDHMAKWFNRNHELVFDIGPYDRIYYTEKDKKDLFDSLGLLEKDILLILQNVFYFNTPYNPQCAKEPYVIVLICAIRYYLMTNKTRNAELTSIYLCFSGKFYASLHGEFFKKFPPSKYRSVMDYVINNMLSAKYDIKTKGSLFGAIESMCKTWIDTYAERLKKPFNDDDCGKHIQQLRDRERSFLRNISNLYYEAYENKYYMNYETDSLDEDNFRLTSNDASEAARITENTMNYLLSNRTNIDYCNLCQDSNVKAIDDLQPIIDNLLSDRNALPELKRVINIIVCDFKRTHPNQKVASVEFLDYTIKPKPNIKDKYLLELKSTIVGWLERYSARYKGRARRKETAISYYRSVLLYFTLAIYDVANKF